MHNEQLTVILTEAELAKNGEELGNLEIQLAATRESKKASAKQFADEITEIEQGIARRAKVATEGQEYREVQVEWQIDMIAGIKRLIRQDNGNDVRNQILSQDEKQYGLFSDPAPTTIGETVVDDELGELPDPETAVQEATADDHDTHQDEDADIADDQYDASHANSSGRGRKKQKAVPVEHAETAPVLN